jgi:hypothetical protein
MNETSKTFARKKPVLLLAVGLLALCGCANHYVLKMNNGDQVDTASKPKLQNGAYHFKDGTGQDQIIPASRVSEIAPASMANEEKKTFKAQEPVKKKHWYFLWLD